MNCPKCSHPMEAVTYKTIEVDRCTHCQGIWFDMLEAEHLKTMKGSQAIDTGKGKAHDADYNKVDRIDCPACHVKMLRMVDARQPHIWYENCPVCYGLFFDAGEFTDFKEESVLDFFRDLVSGGRK
ncbi:MAG: zf-TFIIB domain-containing protein [Planctomycetota bacterium]|nr:zf-TFIIB domain-containing protein [Planctomycetota bacterium]